MAKSPETNERVIQEQIVIDPLFKTLHESGADLSAFVSSHEVDVEGHLKMQSICQKHIDNAVSKTINIPFDYPLEQFSDLLLEYAPTLKGTTIYRSGSRGNEPLVPLTVEEAVAELEGSTQSEVTIEDESFLVNAISEQACPGGVCELKVPVNE